MLCLACPYAPQGWLANPAGLGFRSRPFRASSLQTTLRKRSSPDSITLTLLHLSRSDTSVREATTAALSLSVLSSILSVFSPFKSSSFGPRRLLHHCPHPRRAHAMPPPSCRRALLASATTTTTTMLAIALFFACF
ncbi:hypothetical protein Q7P37_009292 [Cladosporium fusiforme]